MRRAVVMMAALLIPAFVASQAPAQELARGPFERMIIRGVTVIDGTGAPPASPVDIVVEGDRIAQIRVVGDDFGRIDPDLRPSGGDFEIDATGMYIVPGFIDLHVHLGAERTTGLPPAYDYYLRLGHGVTTVLDAGSGNGLAWTVEQKQASAERRIIAPRIFAYVRPGMGSDRPIVTAADAREWVRMVAGQGADGLKLGAHRPDLMAALIDEARAHGLKTTAHLGQNGVTRMNARDAARLGLDHLQHWYGLAEAMLVGRSAPDWRADHNHNNEQDRFSDAGRFWAQAAEPGSPEWNAVIEELLALDLTIVPTSSVYEFLRDLDRRRHAEYHGRFSSPAMLARWEPNPDVHGSFYYYWTTRDETNWYHMFYKWQRFLNEYKNRGGRVAVGADEGSAYALYGFGVIRELELLQQAGFHPLEVIRAATMHGGEALGLADQLGTIELGRIADFVLVDENPLENFKVLYGTGAVKHDPTTGRTNRVGGVKYTIKDGVFYDAGRLLEEVARMVETARRQPVPTSPLEP
jgi:imidazolonepropionase-like amidohydrolase